MIVIKIRGLILDNRRKGETKMSKKNDKLYAIVAVGGELFYLVTKDVMSKIPSLALTYAVTYLNYDPEDFEIASIECLSKQSDKKNDLPFLFLDD